VDPHSTRAARWSRRAAYAVLAIVLTVLAGSTVFAYFLGRAVKPEPKPPLPVNWSAIVDVVAGDGRIGVVDGEATRASFSDLFGITADGDGNAYVADAGDAQRIRRISADGVVSTLAGGTRGFSDGTGDAARFDTPSGLALGRDGAVYVADSGNNAIRRVTIAGVVSTVAGGTEAGYRDGPAPRAEFNAPVGVAAAADGRIIVADTYNDRIRAIDSTGNVSTVAGSGRQGLRDGAAGEAEFDTPCGVAVDDSGNIYVADTGNGVIRKIDSQGTVSTVQPMPDGGYLLRPIGVAVANGRVYATDDHGRVIEITPGKSSRIVAGATPGFANGRGADARMRGLAGLSVAGPGRLIVSDPRNAMIRLVTAVGQGDLRAPPPPGLHPAFDVDRFAEQPLLWPADPMEGPHEITGTMGEARGGETSGRFHAGLDVQAFEGTPVRVVRDGTVSSPVATSDFGTLNESIRIGPIAYVHLRAGRWRSNEPFDDPRFVVSRDDAGKVRHVRVKRGARFTTGEPIGTVNAFNHVHLNVGWPGEEINPLRFRLVRFQDTVAPTISRIELLTLDGVALVRRPREPLLVDRPVRVVVDAWDQADGNEKRRRLGLYQLGYQVLTENGMPVAGFEQPRETIRFDQLAPDPDAARLVYASGSGIPFYGSRSTHFLYVVTNSFDAGRAAAGALDPAALEPGPYIIRVTARDISGNEATEGRDLSIIVARSAN
jgi:sugar lactone lactonase YvrE